MKIAYFSPLNPIKSGISDFSEELLSYLKNYMEIDLFVDNFKPKISDSYGLNIYDINDYEIKYSEYDTAIFHVGNNIVYHKKIVEIFMKFGGILELHDISLHNFIAADTIEADHPEKYVELMKYSHGSKGEKVAKDYLSGSTMAPWEGNNLEFTVNKHLIDKADAVIVHSDYAKQMIKGINQNKIVINISLHAIDLIEDFNTNKIECRKKLGINTDNLIFGSFGFATESKRILQILDALSILRNKNHCLFHYYIVGEICSHSIQAKINDLNLKDLVTVTGFTNLEKFKLYMGACDFCINLRYPTQGESSGGIHRMFGMGKAVIVTRVGTFEEYPDDIVIKIPYDDMEINELCKAIKMFMTNKKYLEEKSKTAYEYAFHDCNIQINAKKYYNFINDVLNQTYQEEYIDTFIDKLMDLGLVESFYIDYLIETKLKDFNILPCL